MILRVDHIAGAAFVGFGVLIIALSGDLPFGDLAMPGAGFMPVLIALLMIVLGIALAAGGRESAPFASVNWSDGKHAALVIAVTTVCVALYEKLGFAITMVMMMMGLLLFIERRKPVRAAIFSIGVVAITLFLFEYVLQTPLAEGPFGF